MCVRENHVVGKRVVVGYHVGQVGECFVIGVVWEGEDGHAG